MKTNNFIGDALNYAFGYLFEEVFYLSFEEARKEQMDNYIETGKLYPVVGEWFFVKKQVDIGTKIHKNFVFKHGEDFEEIFRSVMKLLLLNKTLHKATFTTENPIVTKLSNDEQEHTILLCNGNTVEYGKLYWTFSIKELPKMEAHHYVNEMKIEQIGRSVEKVIGRPFLFL